jgi:hypothetical protein
MSHGIQATCKPNQATKSSKTKIGIVVIAVGLIVAGCAVWQLLNSRVARSVVDQKGKEILKTACLLELTNSWRTVNASGGLVGSPFCSVRCHREYFLEKEGDFTAFEKLSNELRSRHSAIDFHVSPFGYGGTIMTHESSSYLASWLKPETNSRVGDHGYVDGMDLSFDQNYQRWIVYVYGFRKTTNALLYVHIIER